MIRMESVQVTFGMHRSLLGPYCIHRTSDDGEYTRFLVSRFGVTIGTSDGYSTFGKAVSVCEKHHRSLEGVRS